MVGDAQRWSRPCSSAKSCSIANGHVLLVSLLTGRPVGVAALEEVVGGVEKRAQRRWIGDARRGDMGKYGNWGTGQCSFKGHDARSRKQFGRRGRDLEAGGW